MKMNAIRSIQPARDQFTKPVVAPHRVVAGHNSVKDKPQAHRIETGRAEEVPRPVARLPERSGRRRVRQLRAHAAGLGSHPAPRVAGVSSVAQTTVVADLLTEPFRLTVRSPRTAQQIASTTSFCGSNEETSGQRAVPWSRDRPQQRRNRPSRTLSRPSNPQTVVSRAWR